MRVAHVLLALMFLGGGPAIAQTPSAQLRGRVMDESGLPLPATEIVLTSETTGEVRQTAADKEGRFAISGLAAGTYRVIAARTGFRAAETESLPLAAGEDKALPDLVMKVAGIDETVTVTARRREENLQDVPMSVTALGGETLRELAVRDLRGIANTTPNMEFSYAGNASGGGNFAQVFMRGVGQPDFIITKDPGVGIYIDGVYLARAPGSVLELLDVERVEVLRGPQGTLFGKNTIGGAIQVVTKRPNGQFGGEAQLALGSFNRVDLNASVEFPVVGNKLSGRVSALSRNQDGYYRRIAYSEGPANQFGADIRRENGNSTGREAGRVALQFTPTPAMDVLFAADVTRERQESAEYQAVALTTPANVELYQRLIGIPGGFQPYASYIPTQPWESYATWAGYNNSDIWGSSVTATWKGNPVAIKSVTAYRKLFVQTKGDGDATPYNLVSTGGVDIDQHQFSEEVQLSGLALGDRLNWVGGLWYFQETARDIQRSRQFAGLYDVLAAAPFQSIAPGGNPRATCPAANCLGGGLLNANDRGIARLSRTGQRLMDNTSYAGFLHGTFAFSPRVSATVGIRQSRENKEFTYSEIYPLLPLPYRDPSGNLANGNPSFPETTLADHWNVFTPKLGLEVKPSSDVLLYVQGSTGFKAGGFNGRPSPLTGLAPFKPERLRTVEGGVKTDWWNRRLRINGDVFFSNYDDIQISRLSQVVPGVRVEENAGDGRTRGAEFEIAAAPVSGLTLSWALGLLDFEYTSLLPGVVPAAPASTGSISLASQLPFSPKATMNAGVAYSFAVGRVGFMSLRSDYKYSGKYYIDPDNSFGTAQPAYHTIDARAAVTPRSGKIELFVQGVNLTNEAIVANGVTSGPNGSQIVTYKPPRQWTSGIRVTF